MLGLMVFHLALTIGIVIDQHNGHKAMIGSDTKADGTAYLQAGFLDEANLATSRNLLGEYLEVRRATASDPRLSESAMTRSEEIHR